MYFSDNNLPILRFSALMKIALEKAGEETIFHITYPEKEFGDFACNATLILAKKTGRPPREIAEKIKKYFPENDLVGELEIAGPGFLNARLKKDFLERTIERIALLEKSYGKSAVGKGEIVVLDYSSPNVAKPLGVHHLLSTIIGQTLCNFYKELGFQTISVNHIGDWGTQFGKIIVAYKKWGNRKKIEISPISEFLKLYVKFHDSAEKNPELEDEARAIFKSLEEGDPEVTELWKWIANMSYADMSKTYELIGGIHFDEVMGESFYNDKMTPILEEGEKRGIFVTGEKGALVAEFPETDMPPCVIRKSDGATLYITRDLATLRYRIDRWNPEKILYVVDMAQSLHFKQLFSIGRKFEWGKCEAVHVAFGRMSFKDKKMSTRKGNIVLLDEVLDEAVKRALAIVKEKNPDLPNQEDIARKIGIGAVKYSILSQNRQTDI
ncbi:arginine--tRNA ligase, partial [Candidatus Peregrinibacteria bacterium]|nr:arginine--tRNA ligase [Candidatus Peregrinibacteria bacterium]